MRQIVKIIKVQPVTNGFRTTALVWSEGEKDTDEVIGWSKDKNFYSIGDRVMVYFDEKWDKAMMRKTVYKIDK